MTYSALLTGMSLARAAGSRRHRDLTVLNLDCALGHIGIRRLAADMLTLLNHRKGLRCVNRFDLVPADGHIACDVAME